MSVPLSVRLLDLRSPADAAAEARHLAPPETADALRPYTLRLRFPSDIASRLGPGQRLLRRRDGSGCYVTGGIGQFTEISEQFRGAGATAEADLIRLVTDFAFGTAPSSLHLPRRGTHIEFGQRTHVMGIVNVTPDSFSGDGLGDATDTAIEQALAMAESGADVIDIGGESSRPGAPTVEAAVEIDRVCPVIAGLRTHSDVLISVDTWKSPVLTAAVDAGADILNDITGLRRDPELAATAARLQVPVILMHMRGTPATMQQMTDYADFMDDLLAELNASVATALAAGVAADRIMVDPGFGFAKTPAQNLELLRRLREVRSLQCPVLLGTSRKSTIGRVLDAPANCRGWGTAATVAVGIVNGADMIRVHDVEEMAQVARMTDAAVRGGKEWE